MRTIVGGVLGRVPKPTPAMAVALLALLIAASGAAVAAIPSNGTITACYAKNSGALRVIDTGQTCTAKETQLAWKDGSTLLGKNEKATDSDKLDNKDSTEFLGANQKAADSEKLDGKDPSEFLTQEKLDAEAANRQAADTTLQNNIDAEAQARISADNQRASDVKVERLELAKPPINSPQTNSQVVFESAAFEILAECKQFTIPQPPPQQPLSVPVGTLWVVAKEPGLLVRVNRDLGSSSSEIRHQILGTGQRAIFAGEDGDNPNPIEYGSYFVDAPSGFLEGDGMTTFEFDPTTSPPTPGDTCKFSVTGLGKEVSP